jgi:citrate lyase subunit beta/citryl-CoA lyase
LLEEVPDSPLWLRPSAAVPEIGSSEVQIVKHRAIRGLVLPKVESPDQVARMREITGAGKSFVVLVESARALLQSSAIARADGDLRLCFGSVDLLSDVQASSYELIKHCLMQLVLVARDAGIGPPIAGVTVNIHDVRELEAQTRDAISLGCFGKLCIHPSQVRVVNAFHRPSEQKITWAKSVIGLSDGKGVVVYEGKMIDAAVLREAKTILRLAERRN